jgi:aminopeptidase N
VSAKTGYSLEHHMRVYDDMTGDYVEIRPDADGLNLIEINGFDSGGMKTSGLTVFPEAARLIAQALTQVANVILSSANEGANK